MGHWPSYKLPAQVAQSAVITIESAVNIQKEPLQVTADVHVQQMSEGSNQKLVPEAVQRLQSHYWPL